MPNCFTLTLRGAAEASSLASVDEAICEHLGVPVHPTRYVRGWYDTIGLGLAMGKPLSRIREIYSDDPAMLRIASFLEEHYTVDAWAER